MSGVEEEPTLAEIIINQLAFRSLNMLDDVASESTAEAIDGLAEQLRKGALAVYLGLNAIALALEERREG